MTTPERPSYQQRTAYHVTLLGTVALLCSAALVIADLQTREPIEAAQQRRLGEKLVQVLPIERTAAAPLEHAIDLADGERRTRAWQLIRDGRVAAVAVERLGAGYGGPIRVLVGIDRSGTIIASRVTDHQETPGLGDKIEARRTDWIEAFAGRSLANTAPSEWAVRKDGGAFDQFTGATITPRAVVNAVHDALRLFERRRAALLDPATAGREGPLHVRTDTRNDKGGEPDG